MVVVLREREVLIGLQVMWMKKRNNQVSEIRNMKDIQT